MIRLLSSNCGGLLYSKITISQSGRKSISVRHWASESLLSTKSQSCYRFPVNAVANVPSSRRKVLSLRLKLYGNRLTKVEQLDFGHPCPMKIFNAAYVDLVKRNKSQIFKLNLLDVKLTARANLNFQSLALPLVYFRANGCHLFF